METTTKNARERIGWPFHGLLEILLRYITSMLNRTSGTSRSSVLFLLAHATFDALFIQYSPPILLYIYLNGNENPVCMVELSTCSRRLCNWCGYGHYSRLPPKRQVLCCTRQSSKVPKQHVCCRSHCWPSFHRCFSSRVRNAANKKSGNTSHILCSTHANFSDFHRYEYQDAGGFKEHLRWCDWLLLIKCLGKVRDVPLVFWLCN